MSEASGCQEETPRVRDQGQPGEATSRRRPGAVTLRSYLEPEARGGSWEELPTPEARASGREETPHVRGQGQPGEATSHPRPGVVILRSHPEPKARGSSWEEPPHVEARGSDPEEPA